MGQLEKLYSKFVIPEVIIETSFNNKTIAYNYDPDFKKKPS